jgi:hypothetical protein
MKKKFALLCVAALVALFVALVAFIKSDSSSEFVLENLSGNVIRHATVEVSGQIFDFSKIAPGENRTHKFRLGADSHYSVSIIFESGKQIHSDVGYVTSGASSKDELIISDTRISLK